MQSKEDTTMKRTLTTATMFTALLALAGPAIAQDTSSGSGPADATTAVAPDSDGSSDAAAAPDLKGWAKGRPIVMQYYRPLDSRGVNIFETTKFPGAPYTDFKFDIGAAFASEMQNLSHSNTAIPVMASGVNTNQLANIGFGFNNPTANLYLNAQLAPGIRVAAPQRDLGEGRLRAGRRIPHRLGAAQSADAERDAARRRHGNQLR